jgi:hypothetical protein
MLGGWVVVTMAVVIIIRGVLAMGATTDGND